MGLACFTAEFWALRNVRKNKYCSVGKVLFSLLDFSIMNLKNHDFFREVLLGFTYSLVLD